MTDEAYVQLPRGGVVFAPATRAPQTARLGEMVTDSNVRLCALEIASLSARLADMANETGDFRCPLAEIAARMAAVAQELASGSVVELRQSGTTG